MLPPILRTKKLRKPKRRGIYGALAAIFFMLAFGFGSSMSASLEVGLLGGIVSALAFGLFAWLAGAMY